MDFGALQVLALELNFDAHGVAATVTPPEAAAITTKAIWLRPLFEDSPVGRDRTTREPRRVMALRRDQVPDSPLGTIIVAPEARGGVPRNWQIDGVEAIEANHIRVIVVPKTS